MVLLLDPQTHQSRTLVNEAAELENLIIGGFILGDKTDRDRPWSDHKAQQLPAIILARSNLLGKLTKATGKMRS
ncbi:MAG: hypothetical protein HC916_12055 [Coleofasciculaceae cyanobacterium SM2_1_6]|nr:hypothetical protein [Coleofasciculaceae cyanobacterium SM2_1_6]